MSYRSILVHASQSLLAEGRYRMAANIALAEQAQLTGIALSGATDFAYRCGAAATVMPIGPEDATFLTENAQRDLAAFEDAVRSAGVASVTARLCDDTAVSALPLAARYCDLLLIGQRTSPADVFADDGSLARTLLVHAPCPVLVVPADCQPVGMPQRPLIAWDGSMEASRAVRAALPLLHWAQQVEIICFPPQKYVVDGGAAGNSLMSYLACHGINASLVDAPVVPSVGHALLAHAREHAHDLLVMGSFGHSRFREIMLGGATHTVLNEATVPVLMNH